MTPRTIQHLLALVFLGLGGWALFFPNHVLTIVIRPEYQTGDAVTTIVTGCFGAQAVLGGIVILLSRFTPLTFLVFGLLGSLPFFVFNFYFVFVSKIFTSWMVLDFFGNIAIFALCYLGYSGMKKLGLEIT